MIELRVIMENGDYFYTRFNDTEEIASQYYIGKLFNMGTVEDKIVRCVGIEVINNEKYNG